MKSFSISLIFIGFMHFLVVGNAMKPSISTASFIGLDFLSAIAAVFIIDCLSNHDRRGGGGTK